MHASNRSSGPDECVKDWVIVPTADGSHTLVSADGQLTFHSRHGAITESRHVFIQTGLEFWLAMEQNCSKPLRVLEIGLGTGLNASLVLETWRDRLLALREEGDAVRGTGSWEWSYTAMEINPLDPILLGELNYGTHIIHGAWEEWLAGYRAVYGSLGVEGHGMDEGNLIRFESSSSHIVMKILPKEWMQAVEGSYEVIFYDAFGPSVQPELWGEQAVALLAERLAKGGVVVTYGAQGAFRRHLLHAGLLVERLPGPPGKREMLRALKG